MGNFAQKRQSFTMANAIIALISAICLTACATQGASVVLIDGAPEADIQEIVPYEIDEKQRLFVKVMVNDTGPYNFILDTAATSTLIFENVREALGLEFSAENTAFVHGAVLSTKRPALPIDSIKVGALELNNVQSFSLPDLQIIGEEEPIGGVLGIDFLSLYALYFNVRDERIVFAKSGYVPSKKKYVSTPIMFNNLGFLDQGLPFVSASVQGMPLEALLDLGSTVTVVNWAAIDAFGVNVKRQLSGRYEFQGIFADIPIRSKAEGVSVAVGERLWRRQDIDVINLNVFKTMQRGELPTLIVSSSLLRDENFIIDFPRRTLYLEADRTQRVRRRKNQEPVCTLPNGDVGLCTP